MRQKEVITSHILKSSIPLAVPHCNTSSILCCSQTATGTYPFEDLMNAFPGAVHFPPPFDENWPYSSASLHAANWITLYKL